MSMNDLDRSRLARIEREYRYRLDRRIQDRKFRIVAEIILIIGLITLIIGLLSVIFILKK